MRRDKRLAALLASPSASLREISASRLAAFMPKIEPHALGCPTRHLAPSAAARWHRGVVVKSLWPHAGGHHVQVSDSTALVTIRGQFQCGFRRADRLLLCLGLIGACTPFSACLRRPPSNTVPARGAATAQKLPERTLRWPRRCPNWRRPRIVPPLRCCRTGAVYARCLSGERSCRPGVVAVAVAVGLQRSASLCSA
jgi:hypothetical protein